MGTVQRSVHSRHQRQRARRTVQRTPIHHKLNEWKKGTARTVVVTDLFLLRFSRHKLFIQKAWLYTSIVLILVTRVPREFALDGVIKNLTYFNVRVDPNRLCAEHFKRPVSCKPDISKTGSDMNKKSKPTD